MKRTWMAGITLTALVAFLALGGVAFGADDFVRDAGRVQYTAASTISSGDVIDLGDVYGIALVDLASGETGTVQCDGVWDLYVATNDTITVGEKLYWSSAITGVTDTASAGTYIGIAVEASTASSTRAQKQVWINAPFQGIDAQQIDDGDHGDFTYASGVASLDADTVAAAELADADLGDVSVASGVVSLDADVVAAAEMADADHGDVSWSGGVASIDDGVIQTNTMAAALLDVTEAAVTNFDITIVNGVVTSFTAN